MRLLPQVFETCASANSAIPAYILVTLEIINSFLVLVNGGILYANPRSRAKLTSGQVAYSN
jgi:hypothetical protein